MIIKSSLLFDGPRQTMPVWFSFLYFFDWASQLKDAIEANGVESEGRATVAPLAVERGSSFFFVLCCCCCCCCCCGPFLGAGDVVSSRFLLRFYVFFFPFISQPSTIIGESRVDAAGTNNAAIDCQPSASIKERFGPPDEVGTSLPQKHTHPHTRKHNEIK